MKVAILTRTSAVNYGTILQSYALQSYVNGLNATALVVDDVMPRQMYSGMNVEKKRLSFKEKVGDFLDRRKLKKQYANAIKNEKLVRKFKKQYIEYFYPKTLQELNDNFDAFIAGSDQIWAYSAEPYMFPFFLLETISHNKIKASYAVSVGEKGYPDGYRARVEELLNDFDYISVREKSSKSIIGQYTANEVFVACDPVLLIDSKEWVNLAGNRKVNKKYVFCYLLGKNDWYRNQIEEIANYFSCEVIIIQKEVAWDTYEQVNSSSPKDFLNYIEFAEYIVTDSFHGFLFSLIFKKQFCLLQRFLDDGNNTQNRRLLDLIEKLEMNNGLLSEKDEWEFSVLNYDKIDQKVAPFIQSSRDYLKMVLCKNEGSNGK